MEIERLPFGQSLADKIRAAHYRWVNMPPGIPPKMAVEFMEKLKAGSTIRKLTGGGKLGPPMVSSGRFKKYCELNPIWAAEAWRISDANGRLQKGARVRNKTHCRNGHAFSGDNLYVSPDGKERRCWTCMKHNSQFGRRMSEDQARKTIDALKAGAIISDVIKAGAPSYVITHRALQIFRDKNPKFDRLVATLSDANKERRRAEVRERSILIRRSPISASAGADFFQLARNAVPSSLPRQVRVDVIGSMALDLAEGKLQPDDMRRRVREYITAHFRMFSKFGPRSLDAPLSADGSATLLDMLSTDAGTGYWDPNMMASTGRRK
jgi:hypothetical protein